MEKISAFVGRQGVSPARGPRGRTPPASSASKGARRVNADPYATLKAQLVTLYAQNDAVLAALRESAPAAPAPDAAGFRPEEAALLAALEEKRRLAALVDELRAAVERQTALVELLERLANVRQEGDGFRASSEDGALHLRFTLSEEGEQCRVCVLETNLPPHKELTAGAQLKFNASAVHDFFCLLFVALNDQLLQA